MSIMDWPAAERPREKLLDKGPEALSDAELLAIFLRTGVAGMSAVDLSRQLLDEFGGLRPLLEASEKAFCKGHGLGVAKFVQLQAVLEISRRHLQESMERESVLTSVEATEQYLSLKLRHQQQEVFAALFLDSQHRVIEYQELFYGTIDGASVHPREVVKQALACNAAAVIFAHNHPSGVAEPSQADIRITERLRDALGLVEVRLLDHFIVGDGKPLSMAQRGLI